VSRLARLLLSLLVLATLSVSTPAATATRTTVIDDSATLPYDTPVTLHWQPPIRGARGPSAMVGTMTLRVSLNLMPFLHHAGRIYLALPAQQPTSLQASWTTRGRLLPGSLSAGRRTLVYSGPITSSVMEDVLQLTLRVDPAQMQQVYHVNFQFQMDEG
jgi:hypothetical protein